MMIDLDARELAALADLIEEFGEEGPSPNWVLLQTALGKINTAIAEHKKTEES